MAEWPPIFHSKVIIQLARWQRNWQSLWADTDRQIKMSEQARVWSEWVLELSGILSEEVASPEAS